MKSSMKWSILLSAAVLSAAVLGACGVVDDAAAPAPAAELTQAAIVVRDKPLEPVAFNCGWPGFRCQTADIAEVSASDFVVAYINASGQLKYAYYGAAGQEVAPFAKGTSAKWVRANSSKPWGAFGCNSTYFAVQVDDPQLGGKGVYLDAHSKCASGWTSMTRTLIAAGPAASAPSVATKGDPLWGDVFIAWSEGPAKGRLLRHRFQNPGGGLTAPFSAGGFASSGTDIIYNQHADRWIVGAVARGWNLDSNVTNAVLTANWDSLPQIVDSHELGHTGGTNDGHHNYVAYNPLSEDGSYVHWYQNPTDGKGTYTHASDGSRMLSVPPLGAGNGFTVPLAQTYSAQTPYVAWATNESGTDVYGRRQDKTWTLLGHVAARTTPVTVRALPNAMVALFSSGRLVTADFPFSTRMTTLQASADQRLIYANGEGDSIFQKWKTSSAGNGTWSAATLVNHPWNKAKDVVVEVRGDGLLEAIYIGTNDLIYRTTQSSSDPNAWTGEELLFDANTQARAIAVTGSPPDGRLVVFFARSSDQVLCQSWQTGPDASTWTMPAPVIANPNGNSDATARLITAFVNSNNRLEIVYTRPDGLLRHTFQTSSVATSWSVPTPLNGPSDTATRLVKAVEPIGGRRLIYTAGGIDHLYETRQTAPGVWNGQSLFGGTIWHNVYEVAVARNGDGVLEVFAVGTDNAVTHRRQTMAGGAWGGSLGFPGAGWITAKRLAVSRNSQDRLELYYVGMDDVIYHTSQVNPNGTGGNWHVPAPL
jgi:hypothetical protein